MGVGDLGEGGGGVLGLEGTGIGSGGGGGDLGGDLVRVGTQPVGLYINGSCVLVRRGRVCTLSVRPSSREISITSGLYAGYKSTCDLTVPGTSILARSDGASSTLYLATALPAWLML